MEKRVGSGGSPSGTSGLAADQAVAKQIAAVQAKQAARVGKGKGKVLP